MYYAFIRTTPGGLNLWTGSAYNQVLAQLSTEDSQRTARILYDVSLPFLSPAQVQRALPGFLVCVDMIGSISLVAARLSHEEGENTVQEMKRLIMLYAADLLDIKSIPA